jgi:hemoglobin-like flavoprotein
MLSAEKKLIQDTWAQVVPIADRAATLFYQRLFEIDPSTRSLFQFTDMAQQRKKLLQVLSVAVSSLDNLGALRKTVEDLGRRHAGYGVKDAHYDSVGVALLWTLEQGLGSAWTPEVASAWKDIYGLLSGIMRQAQQGATAKAA